MMPFSECHANLHARLPRFYPALALGASLVLAQPGAAQMALDSACKLVEGDPQSCSHVIACIGGETVFVGGSVGWGAGTVYGRLDSGARCTGAWDNAAARAEFECDDGTRGAVNYTVFDGPTGTAIGRGTTEDGRGVDIWSGENVREFLAGQTDQVILQCGVQDVPMM